MTRMKIGKKMYTLKSWHKHKSKAKREIERLRKKGYMARMKSYKDGVYEVWKRKK